MANLYKNSEPAETGMFATIEFAQNRKRSFWTSVGMHGVLLTAILLIQFFAIGTLQLKHYDVWMLAPPPPPRQVLEVTHWKLPTPPSPKPAVEKPIPQPRITVPKVEPVRPLEKPAPKPLPKPEIAEVPKPAPQPILPAPAPAPAPAPPPKAVKTNVFGDAPAPKPTVNLPPQQVQTGGFGDPNGARGVGRPDKPSNIASLGSFDLPVGPGAGNGTGGANGVRGVVASSGFGNGTAPAAKTARSGSSDGVHEGGFGDANSGSPGSGSSSARAQRPVTPVETPAQIVFKPKPDYTEEARRMRIEGEVLLRVLFSASGEVRVLDTVSALGHGLDDSAVRAARQIRFKPAMREGRPVDSTAVVHIVFQLAY
jgi:TonB family protein